MKLTLALLSLLLPAAALAADSSAYPPEGLEVGGRGVYYHADDSDHGTFNPGAQARFHLNQWLAAEGSVDYQRHDVPATTAHSLATQLSLLLYIRPARLTPFLLAGGGWYLTRVDGPDLRRNLSRFGPHVGFGAQFWLTDRWSVDMTYRYVWLEDIHTRDEATLLPRDFRRSGNMVTLGVNVALPK